MADETETAEQEDEEREEASGQSEDSGQSEESDDEKDEAQKAQEKEEEREQARDKVQELEEGEPPDDLEDWPDDAAKYETFGGPEGEHGYHEGPEEEKLGPSSLRHKEDGGVTIAGDEVDDPDQYKSDPIPGGPTDPNASQDLTSQKIREDQGRDLESSAEDGTKANDDSEDDDSDDEPKAESESDSESDSDDE